MDIPTDIENALKKFNGLKDDEKAKAITLILNEVATKKNKNGESILEKYFDIKNIILQIEKVINKETGKRGNARSDIIGDSKIIFIDIEKAGDFYNALLKIDRLLNLNENEILAISYYAHEYIHHLQKELWNIDIKKRKGKIASAISETLTELIGRKLTINYLCDIYGKGKASYFAKILNKDGAYNTTVDRFRTFFNSLGKKNILNEIEDMLNTIDHKEIVKNLVDLVNEGREIKLDNEYIVDILLGRKWIKES